MEKFTPLYDKLLVEVLAAPDLAQHKSGLFIPLAKDQQDPMKGGSIRGKVVAVGSGHFLPDGRTVPLLIQEGDVVVINSFSHITPVVENGVSLILVKEEAVLAIVSEI